MLRPEFSIGAILPIRGQYIVLVGKVKQQLNRKVLISSEGRTKGYLVNLFFIFYQRVDYENYFGKTGIGLKVSKLFFIYRLSS